GDAPVVVASGASAGDDHRSNPDSQDERRPPMTRSRFAGLSSPIGRVRVIARDGAICRVDFETHAAFDDSPRGDERPEDPLLALALRQLGEYFAGERAAFDLPLEPERGTPF